MVREEVVVEGEGGAGAGEDTETTKVDLHIAVQCVTTSLESP